MKRILHKRNILLFLIVSLILLQIVGLIRKYCVYYNTPEEAYKAGCKGRIYQIIEGATTDYVIGNKDSVVIEKSEKGWKVPTKSTILTKVIKNVGDINICLWQYNYSDEYYLTISGSDELELSDNRNSKFYYVDVEPNGFSYGVKGYFAYIQAIDEEYIITIDGLDIQLLE